MKISASVKPQSRTHNAHRGRNSVRIELEGVIFTWQGGSRIGRYVAEGLNARHVAALRPLGDVEIEGITAPVGTVKVIQEPVAPPPVPVAPQPAPAPAPAGGPTISPLVAAQGEVKLPPAPTPVPRYNPQPNRPTNKGNGRR